MKRATFGFLISTILLAFWWMGKTDNIIGWTAFVVCIVCVGAQIVSIAKERR